MAVVLSIGGSCVNPEGKPDVEFVRAIAAAIKKSNEKIGILVGGGKTAREYAEAARNLGASEFEADELAIMSTRQNAMLLVAALKGTAYPVALTDFINAKKAAVNSRVVIMGGTIPGVTTDTDAVLLAEAIGAKRLVNISHISGIFNKDPRKFNDAKKFDRLSFDEMIALAMESDKRKAGTNFVFDMVACKLIARSKIETHFVGKEISEIEKAIAGKKHNGSVVC
jgi:uridylate kinase